MLKNFLYKLKNHLNSVIIIWLLSYIVVFSIPAISNIFIYNKATKATKEETEILYSRFLNELTLSTDNIFEICSRIQVSFAANEKVRKMMTENFSQAYLDEYSIGLSKDLKAQIINTNFVDIYIKFNNLDYVVSTTHLNNSEEFFKYFYNNSNLSDDIWYQNMTTQNYGNYMFVQYPDKHYVEFMYQLPTYAEAYVNATIVIRMATDVLGNQITLLDNIEKTNIAIINPENDILFQSITDKKMNPGMYKDYPNEAGIIENSENVYVYQTAKTNKWKYITITPQSIFWSKLQYMKNINLLLIFISIGVSAILGLYFTMINYKPFKVLLSAYKNAFNGNSGDKNTYDFINEVVKDYIESKKNIKKMEADKRNDSINLYFSNLLLSSDLNPVTLSELDIEFTTDKFSIIVFKIKGKENLFGNDKDETTEKESSDMVLFIMQNIMEELFNTDHKCYVAKIDNQIVAIINFKNNKDVSIYKIKAENIILEGRNFIKKNFNFSFSTGISSIIQGGDQLTIAYNEALCALNFRGSGDEDKIIFYNEIYHYDTKDYDIDFYNMFSERERNLESVIETGDYRSAKCMVEGILEECVSNLDIDMLRIFMFSLANTLLKTVDLTVYPPSHDIIKNVNHAMKFNSLPEIQGSIYNLLEQIFNIKKSDKETEHIDSVKQEESIVEQVIDYIRKEYKNNNLNISNIGYHFNVSPYYISKLFKDTTKENMLDYIGKLRVEKAKEYIETTGMTMNEIYNLAGFNNEKTFVRAFKKYLSNTPNSYREEYRKNKSIDNNAK